MARKGYSIKVVFMSAAISINMESNRSVYYKSNLKKVETLRKM